VIYFGDLFLCFIPDLQLSTRNPVIEGKVHFLGYQHTSVCYASTFLYSTNQFWQSWGECNRIYQKRVFLFLHQ